MKYDTGMMKIAMQVAGAVLGGVIGALGFNHLGYIATVPLALLLVLLASVPALDDLLLLTRRVLRR